MLASGHEAHHQHEAELAISPFGLAYLADLPTGMCLFASTGSIKAKASAGGICCIDEFDGIREADKVSIHEVMEQQTLSIAKAGLITTLTTRTSIFGSMNPRGNPKDSIAEQTHLSGPLLSRFDILLPVHDVKSPEEDERVADHILNNHQHDQPSSAEVSCSYAQALREDVALSLCIQSQFYKTPYKTLFPYCGCSMQSDVPQRVWD